MRKLIPALVVIAVVSCALAFKTKPLAGLYCGSQTQNSGCHVLHKKEITGVANFFVNLNFDGTNCNPNDCPTAIRLSDE